MQASLAGTLERICPLGRVRAFASNGEAVAGDVWRGLVELGAAGILIDEEHGGLGLTLLDAALVRLLLLPVLLRLMGKWAWYLPRWARRILPNVTFGHA